jgi:hypothetical protein
MVRVLGWLAEVTVSEFFLLLLLLVAGSATVKQKTHNDNCAGSCGVRHHTDGACG